MRGKSALAAIAIVTLGVAGSAIAAPTPVKRTVKVGDNFFSPAKLTLPKGSTIAWKWPRVAGDVHDVYLAAKPKGVKRFHSEAAASDYSFKRKLKLPGKYFIVCTLHEEMTMSVRVKK